MVLGFKNTTFENVFTDYYKCIKEMTFKKNVHILHKIKNFYVF